MSNRDLARASSSRTVAGRETELNIDRASTLEIIHDHIRDEATLGVGGEQQIGCGLT